MKLLCVSPANVSLIFRPSWRPRGQRRIFPPLLLLGSSPSLRSRGLMPSADQSPGTLLTIAMAHPDVLCSHQVLQVTEKTGTDMALPPAEREQEVSEQERTGMYYKKVYPGDHSHERQEPASWELPEIKGPPPTPTNCPSCRGFPGAVFYHQAPLPYSGLGMDV